MLEDVLRKFKKISSEQVKRIYLKNGADLEFFGVKLGDTKKFVKKYKNNSELGYQLLHSNVQEAIILSQFILNSTKLTTQVLLTV